MLKYIEKCFHIYVWNILQWINKHILYTYLLIEDCSRCEDCGRNVHDYDIPDEIWLKVIGSENGTYCYDCFVNRADEKFGTKERGKLINGNCNFSHKVLPKRILKKWRMVL